MKTIKKTLALILALTMVLAMSANVLAWTVTIDPNLSDTASHTYSAYQLFTGDVVEEGGHKVLSNIVWGANVDPSKLGNLADAINAITGATGDDALTAASSADDFADALSELNAAADDTTAQAVADAFGAVLTGSPVVTNASPLSIGTAGYYIIKDSDAPVTGNAAKTRYILQVVGNVTVKAKSEVPSIDKKITEEGKSPASVNEASIGDTVPFTVTSAVPNMTGYNNYYFNVHDTMSKGLTFEESSVTITIGGTALASDAYYVEAADDANGVTNIKIVLKNFLQYADREGAAIVIKYSAVLNENAELAPDPNENEVYLVFSNDPNFNYQGKPTAPGEPNNPDEPNPGAEPTGKTPESKTETYTTELTVLKTDESGKALPGAEFTLTGGGVNIVLVTSEEYAEDASGAYWKLKDGTYTTDDPSDPAIDETLYEDTATKYAKTTTTTAKGTLATPTDVACEVGNDGKVTFTGLGAGVYTLTETKTPAGYNTEDPITFTVTFDPDAKQFTSTTPVTATNSKLSTTVVNQKGNTLPTTGGMGTTLFYVLGTLMALGACVVLISRKRAGAAA